MGETKRPRGNPNWVKGGPSPNPDGRSAVAAEFRLKCQAIGPEILKAWEDEVKGRGEHWVRASELIAGYAYGKPAQAITGENGGPVEVAARLVVVMPDNGRGKK